MKNRMIKRSHLTEKKCREIIQLFAEDLTATQIANITAVSRVTINNYLKLIRIHIAKYCEERNPKYVNRSIVPFVSMYKKPEAATSEVVEECHYPHYGFYRHNGNIYVDWLQNIDKHGVVELQKQKALNGSGVIHDEELAKYNAIADFDGWRLYRLDNNVHAAGRGTVDDISVFWGNTKSRLLKFRGLNKSTMYLHVKECEFRFNYRNEDINNILLTIIYKRPLHLSRNYV